MRHNILAIQQSRIVLWDCVHPSRGEWRIVWFNLFLNTINVIQNVILFLKTTNYWKCTVESEREREREREREVFWILRKILRCFIEQHLNFSMLHAGLTHRYYEIRYRDPRYVCNANLQNDVSSIHLPVNDRGRPKSEWARRRTVHAHLHLINTFTV